MTRPAIAATALCSLALAYTSVARAEPVVLWHAYDEAEAHGLSLAVQAFERANPDIDVQMLAVPYDAYHSKLENAIPTGHGPDVFLVAHDALRTFSDEHLLAPMTRIDPFVLGDLEDAHVGVFRVGRSLVGLPIALKCTALYVNEDLVHPDPTTLEAIAAMRGRAPAGGAALVLEAENSYHVAALLHAFGGSLLHADGTYGFVGPEAERTVTFLARLVRMGVVPQETNGVLVSQLFAGGRALTAIDGPWLAPHLPRTLHWHVLPLPRVDAAGGAPMRSFVTVEGAVLAAQSEHAIAAQKLIVFLASNRGSIPRALVGRQIVVSRTAALDPRVRGDRFLATFRQAADIGIVTPTHVNMRATFEPARQALQNALRGDLSVRDALVEGEHRFESVTRPPPERSSPMLALIVLGVVLAFAGFGAVQRATDPSFRAAVRRSMPAYAYVTHAAVAVGLLVVLPLLAGALTSFFAGHGRDMVYVGLANYVDILTARGGDLLGHGSFWLVLLVTVLWTAVNLALHVSIGVALGLLLHRPWLRLRGVYRVLLILPWAVPSYVTALAWKGMFHRQFGAVNAILAALGAQPVSWFAKFSTAFCANVVTNTWLGFPFMLVVTLGALSSIPKDLYEAAAVDGASAWQQFRLITLPLLRPALAPAVAMGAVWTFNMFNVVFLVSGGEPDGSTEILVSEAYRWAFTRSQQYGYAAAYAVLIFCLLALTTRRFSRSADGAGATT